VVFPDVRRQQKPDGAADINRGAAHQKQRGIGSERVFVPIFCQEAVNGQKIAKDANAAFGRPAAFGNCCGGAAAFGNRGEDFQFNRGLHGLGLLESIHRAEEALGGHCVGRCRSHDCLL
jgi:hypothetical protein